MFFGYSTNIYIPFWALPEASNGNIENCVFFIQGNNTDAYPMDFTITGKVLKSMGDEYISVHGTNTGDEFYLQAFLLDNALRIKIFSPDDDESGVCIKSVYVSASKFTVDLEE